MVYIMSSTTFHPNHLLILKEYCGLASQFGKVYEKSLRSRTKFPNSYDKLRKQLGSIPFKVFIEILKLGKVPKCLRCKSVVTHVQYDSSGDCKLSSYCGRICANKNRSVLKHVEDKQAVKNMYISRNVQSPLEAIGSWTKSDAFIFKQIFNELLTVSSNPYELRY